MFILPYIKNIFIPFQLTDSFLEIIKRLRTAHEISQDLQSNKYPNFNFNGSILLYFNNWRYTHV